MKINSTSEKIKHKAFEAIIEEFNNVTQVMPTLKKMTQTLENIIPLLSEYYKCNLIVHENRGVDFIVFSHPEKKSYRHDWPRVDLHQKMDPGGKFGHIRLLNPRNTNYVSRNVKIEESQPQYWRTPTLMLYCNQILLLKYFSKTSM